MCIVGLHVLFFRGCEQPIMFRLKMASGWRLQLMGSCFETHAFVIIILKINVSHHGLMRV